MPRDYAKRNRKRTRARPRVKKAKLPAWLWLVVGLLMGLFIAGLFYLHNAQQKPTQKKKTRIVKTVKSNKKTHAKKTKETKLHVQKEQKPQFDFYTILPNKSQEPSIPEFAESNTTVKAGSEYILQVASVRKYADADRLKAQLTLLGFDVRVKKVNLGQSEWNRVYVGPFVSAKIATANQKRLQQKGFNSILLRVK